MRTEPLFSTPIPNSLSSPQQHSPRDFSERPPQAGLYDLPNELLAGRVVTYAIAQGDGRLLLQTSRRLRGLTIERVHAASQQQLAQEQAYITGGATSQESVASEDAFFVHASMLRSHLLCPNVTLQQWRTEQESQGARYMQQAMHAWRLAHEDLNLGGHRMTELPAGFLRHQSSLRKLHLDTNRLTSIPSCIGSLRGLTELTASDNQLMDLPATMVQLRQLKVLHLNDNKFSSIPDSLLSLHRLDDLRMDRNLIFNLPSGLLEMNLRNLSLNNNLIEFVPRFNSLYSSMKTLYLSNNLIAAVPPETFSPDLIELKLKGNRLTTLQFPERVCPKLTALYLHNNCLQSAQYAWNLFPGLMCLTLHQNAITHPPTTLFQRQKSLVVYLSYNPLSIAGVMQYWLDDPSIRGTLCVDDSQVSETYTPLREIRSETLTIRIYRQDQCVSYA